MFSIFRDSTAAASLRDTYEEASEPQRRAILRAISRLERHLRYNPHQQGESRQGQTRILFEAPLAMLFEVDDAQRMVRVLRIWMIRRAA
jgi:uncharacterized heparinase superfamily protein